MTGPRADRHKQQGPTDGFVIMKSGSAEIASAGFPVSKLERETLHDRAYLELKRAIMSGAIRPGSTITIRAMAAALGTSPMPVREALRRLVAERALEMLPTRSVALPLITPERFDEICRIRITLEGMVTETAAALLGAEELQRMVQVNGEMWRLKRQQTTTYLAKNQEFHFRLYQASQMPTAMQMIESLWLQAGPLLNLALSEFGLRVGQDHHAALLEALERRDGKAARIAIQEDIGDAAKVIREFLETRGHSAA
ncbi:GntR family transcriptional regulator [Hypericibacter adhaerens]|uniref:GntR family transcriptional regulator n=2 Tax=Hypericibacter adhaerens TaxID=2602016 RepID=A0A5J6N0F8_9PROT|nr:GntR family transcriptional regulator [Hypericibacter adhaerens]